MLIPFLQDAAAKPEGSSLQFIIMLVGMFVIMYFFFIRPQQKKTKEANKFREAMKKGDSVTTIGGIHGKIAEISGDTIVLSVEQGKIRVSKSAVSSTGGGDEQEMAARK